MNKFTNRYLSQFEILNKAIVGYEFEFYTERSYYKLLELLNRELAPVKVTGYRKYHSSGEVDDKHYKIEPDLSGGFDLVELITGPTPYVNARLVLLKIMNILQKHGRTDDKCSIHINISFDKEKTDKVLDRLNPLKLILNVDEDMIYKLFPERKSNFYAKSVKKLIPYKNFNFSSTSSHLIQNNLQLPDTKYYGINIANSYKGRLEYRYIGGKDYDKKTDEVLELLDYFIILTWNCINTTLDEKDIEELNDYLLENINQFKNFANLDNFIAEFLSIRLQVDMSNDYTIVKSYYDDIYNELYDIIINIYNLSDCIINYDTDKQKIEIVDASFKSIFDIKNINIIDSNVDGGSFINCDFINCDVKNAHLTNCKLIMTDIFNSKIEVCEIDRQSTVIKCYIFNSLLDGKMDSGVFRSGKLGEFGELGKDVKIVTDQNNYFGDGEEQTFKQKIKDLGTFKNDTNFNKKKFLDGYNAQHNPRGGDQTTF